MFRNAQVAGQFYPSDPGRLRADLSRLVPAAAEPVHAFGAVAPHAGYVYSGAVAGKVFGAVAVPQTVVVINPNHTGQGVRAALWAEGSWRTPLGDVPVDEALAAFLMERAPVFKHDPRAHLMEHSGEVMLPFLQHRNPEVSVVPLCLMGLKEEEMAQAASALAAAVRLREGRVLVLASSDMNHFEDDAATRVKDQAAMDRILALDGPGLLSVTRQREISMCGVYPAALMLEAARLYGVREVRAIAYDTSASAFGDKRRVVGYFGAIVV